MSNYSNTQDILNDALNRAGELTDGSSVYQQSALAYINEIYTAIYAGGNEFEVELGVDWEWARNQYPMTMVLDPPYYGGPDFGTGVNTTYLSTTVTFTVPPAFSVQGWHLKVDQSAEYYRIVNHTAGSPQFTIDVPYTDNVTVGPDLAFQIMHLDYQLPATNIMRLIGPFNIYRTQDDQGDDEGKIYFVKYNYFMKNYPFHNLFQNLPTRATELYRDVDGNVWVRFNGFPYYSTKVELDWIPNPAVLTNDEDSIPVMPQQWRVILSYAATHFIMNDKSDSRAQTYYAMTKAKMNAMVTAYRKEKNFISKNRGRLIPRLDLYTRVRRLVRQENN
jgi:hypothetical protein